MEPTTYGLKVRYSAIELAPLAAKRNQLRGPLGNGFRMEVAPGWAGCARSLGGVFVGSRRAGRQGKPGWPAGRPEREVGSRFHLRAIILPRPPPVPYALQVPDGRTSRGKPGLARGLGPIV